MKKLLFALLGLFIVAAATVLLAPQFIDVNVYKPEIESQFKSALGYDLDMKGEIKLSFFPKVKATVKDVSIFNNSKNLINIEQITAYPKLQPLLSGKLEFSSIAVEKPVVMLEKDEDSNNWEKIAAVPGALGKPGSRLIAQVTSVEVIGGKMDFADKVKKKTYSFSEVNLKTYITSVAGPVRFDGGLKFNNIQVGLKGKIENFAAPRLYVATDILGSEIAFDGTIDSTEVNGKFAVKSKDIAALAEFLKLNEIKHLSRLPIDISGEINYGEKEVDFKNLKLAIGDSNGAGDLSFAIDGNIAAAANLKFQSVNLDQLVPKSTAKAVAAEKLDESDASQENGKAAKREISAEINIAADSVVYGGVVYKDLIVKSTSDGGEISVQPFSFKFPKSGSAEIFGVLSQDSEGRFFEGHINAESANLSDILRSLKVNLEGLKKGTMQNFKLDSELVVNLRDKASAELSQTTLKVDDALFQGNISLDLNALPGIDVNGTITALDLDKYTAPKKSILTSADDKSKATGPTDDKPFRIIWLEELPFKGSTNMLIGKLSYDSNDYSNVRLRGNFQPETLNIDEVTLSGKKIQLAAKGSLYAYPGKKMKVNIEANFGKIDLADFLKEEPIVGQRPQDKTRWSKQPFDLSFLRRLDMDFSSNIISFVHNKFILNNVAIKGYIEKGKLVVEKATGDMFGGKVNMNGGVEATAVPSISFAYSGASVDVNKLLDAVFDDKRVNGKANFSGSVASSGIYQQAMINNLMGSLAVASNNLVIKGFNLDGLTAQVTNTNNIADISSVARTVTSEDAVTYLKSVIGAIIIENGVARNQMQGIEIQTASGPGLFSGRGDILNWNMDTNAVFKLVMSGTHAQPAVVIHIFGPLDEPKKDVNLDEVRRFISGRGAKLLLNGVPDTEPSQPPIKPVNDKAHSEEQPEAAHTPVQPGVNPNDRFAAARTRRAAKQAIRMQKLRQTQPPATQDPGLIPGQ